jgi:outer membrane lipoprotein carrier protein
MKSIIAAIIAVAFATGAQAQSPDAIMNRAVKAYADMHSVRASFTQTIMNPITGTNAVSKGTLLRKDPNLLSIEFSSPKGDRIVSDGTTLWVYLPSSAPNQVVKMSARSSGTMAMVDPAGSFLTSPSTRFAITSGGTATVSGQKTNVVNLVPKQSNDAFTRAKLWIDASDYSIRQFEVVDANGLMRTVTITSIQSNPAIGAAAFSFTPPRGVRVLDSSALSGM